MEPIRRDNILADEARRQSTRPVRRTEVASSEIGDETSRRRQREPEITPEAHAAISRMSLRASLHSHATLRQAIILTEIIGPPKALRAD